MTVANLWSYWAHLSIYRFALPLAQGRAVLEAGTGAGYGAAYLARNGATRVLGFEASPDAVAYSRRRFAGDAVTYEVGDLNLPLPVGNRLFDLIFSSNVFEHVAHVDRLMQECSRVVTEEGVVVIAVPPITSHQAMAEDMRSQFHIHHIPPWAWHAKLLRFFGEVQCHRHIGLGVWADDARMNTEVAAPADAVTIRETDFGFPKCEPADLLQGSITAVFVCRKPRAEPGPETLAERTPADWTESAAAAQLIGTLTNALNAERSRPLPAPPPPPPNQSALLDDVRLAAAQEAGALRQALAEAQARIAALEGSTTWRAAAPVRRLATLLRPGR